MRKIREILRFKYEVKLSHGKIASALGVSKGVVTKYVSLAQARGIDWPLPEGQDDTTLERLLLPPREPVTSKAEPDCFQIHTELKRKGVTMQLLWSEYTSAHGTAAYRYSRFCERYRHWRQQQKRSMRQQHLTGEKP